MMELLAKIVSFLYIPWKNSPPYLLMRYVRGEYYRRHLKAAGKKLRLAPGCCVRGGGCISLGADFRAEENLVLSAWTRCGEQTFTPEIKIGSGARLGRDCHITAINRIIIGDGLLTGADVLISDNSHGDRSAGELALPPAQRPLHSKGPVIIGNNVWLGDGVKVLAGVTIGDNVTVGANAVVTKDIPANCVAVGIPARVVDRSEQEKG